MKYLRARVQDHLTFEEFYAAHLRASRHKHHRDEVLLFNANMESNLLYIMDVVSAGKYVPSTYNKFKVTDPKPRDILALPYTDRVVHQWAVEVFYKPYYYPRFIKDSYACLPERGMHKAARQVQLMIASEERLSKGGYYIVKMDISKYFNNIDKQILFDIMASRIADPELLRLTHTFIFDGDDHPGIPIGNYTSQLFANVYLNELDQFAKNELKVKNYIRYMDDFIAIVPGKATAQWLYCQLEAFVNDRLGLKLNPKSRYYPGYMGVDFAGYRIFYDHLLLRKRNKVKLLQSIIPDFKSGKDPEALFVMRVNAWYGHAKHANCYRFVERNLSEYRDILPVIFGDKNSANESSKNY